MIDVLNCGITALTMSLQPSPARGDRVESEALMNIALALPLPTWAATNCARFSS